MVTMSFHLRSTGILIEILLSPQFNEDLLPDVGPFNGMVTHTHSLINASIESKMMFLSSRVKEQRCEDMDMDMDPQRQMQRQHWNQACLSLMRNAWNRG